MKKVAVVIDTFKLGIFHKYLSDYELDIKQSCPMDHLTTIDIEIEDNEIMQLAVIIKEAHKESNFENPEGGTLQ